MNSRVSLVVSGKVEFGVIPHDHWFQPDSIDEEKAKAGRDAMVAKNIIYGGSVSYRNMCRFNSGVRSHSFLLMIIANYLMMCFQFFFKHPLMQKYRWYWRIE